ncbi:TRAP transporter small permease [Agitococcus lubricus]|uniref:TRAP transporter small permease protein n=1 Tax=Agitococcus lubricus TaxID=1077255 RepID=A0A2T5IYL8_9GAMM|nr:TRAP transporter small permease subunit [Agitococcus lubricus]PTQ89083.1 TRAP-type C4-dicarboxylate transport system permease small subunit [Agitococcus lubricus]
MLYMTQTLLRCLHRLEDALLVSLLFVMMSLAVTQIVLRNGFDTGILWADAFLRVSVLWIALIGALVATRQKQHIQIDVLSRFLPAITRYIATIMVNVFSALVCGLLAYYCFDFVKMEYEAPSMAFANVPTWLCEAVMPVAFGFMAVRYFLQALVLIFNPVKTESTT